MMRFVRLEDLTLIALGCFIGLFGQVYVANGETVSERFEKAMKKKAEYCATHKIDPANHRCDITKLQPADPLATEEGRFAHSIKIPNPVPEDSGYKPGMTPEQYFDHLCRTEAGEFIYKIVENVDGLLIMRPGKPNGYAWNHLYALEAPYGEGFGTMDHPEEYFVQPALGKYEFLEMPVTTNTGAEAPHKYRRFYRDEKAHPGKQYQTAINGQFKMVPYIVAEVEVSTPTSRYGFTWRGIARPHDRELGIGGGEIIVQDLQTNEVLAVRRGFVLGTFDPNLLSRFSWSTGNVCPGREAKSEHAFVKEVLRPALRQSMGGGQ